MHEIFLYKSMHLYKVFIIQLKQQSPLDKMAENVRRIIKYLHIKNKK